MGLVRIGCKAKRVLWNSLSTVATVAYAISVIVFANSAFAEPPAVLIIKDKKLTKSPGGTVLEENLKKLRDQHGIEITSDMIGGYILDLDAKDEQYEGFNLVAEYDGPLLAKFFHNPEPKSQEITELNKERWKHATTGATSDTYQEERVSLTMALAEIDHAYFPASKFADQSYCNMKSGEANTEAYEALLHESLHIWHNRNRAKVDTLLKTSGSYFDRVKKTKRVCKNYLNVWEGEEVKCGLPSQDLGLNAVMNAGRWPQRWGKTTNRLKCREATKPCAASEQRQKFSGKMYCIESTKEDFLKAFDLNSIRNEDEYFAIMMQLYAFNRAEFERISSPEEKKFAKWLFTTGLTSARSQDAVKTHQPSRSQ
jgi:hypothetical protein